MDNQGYIKLHRKILDNPISKNPEYCWLWCILLMKANHKETDIIFNSKKEKIKIGEFITGRKQLSLESGISESKIQRILKYLEIEQQIEQQTNNKFRRILIKNYKQYQQSEQQNEQPVNNKRTTSEQPVNTNKNDKNENNEKNNTVLSFSEFWDLYDKKRGDKTKLEKKYNGINEEDRKKIMAHVKAYKLAQPDKQFRKDPATYLNNRGWEDEIIYSHKNQVKQQNQPIDLTGRW